MLGCAPPQPVPQVWQHDIAESKQNTLWKTQSWTINSRWSHTTALLHAVEGVLTVLGVLTVRDVLTVRVQNILAVKCFIC